MNVSEDGAVARLTVSYQGKILSVWDIPKGAKRIIGRGNDVHYQIKSVALSRHHCQISDTDSGLELLDLNSRNGTFVNHKKVTKSVLQDGDEIQFGPLVIKIKTGSVSEEKGAVVLNHQGSKVSSSPIVPPGKSLCPPQGYDVPETLLRRGGTLRKPVTQEIPRLATPSPSLRKSLWEAKVPHGPCLQCGKNLPAKAMLTHRGIFKGNQIFCLSCFCGGAGNFPTIAGYRIVKKLGGGGMGEVYEAIQLSMERPVAFKLMKGLENANDQQIRRFFREARTGGSLTHPNIVGFIDAGKLEGACFITMEYVDGIDVKQIIAERGSVPYLEALRIGYYVATALDYAHSRFNIVHRDVKPENILVARDDSIKLADFGLAKNLEDAGLSGITQSQTGVGTLFYMSPEQIANARFADHRADIYSLGISLYEMMAGTRPFTADDMMTLVNKIRNDPPIPVTEKVSGIPPEIWAIVAKAMAKNPADRYQSAKEMSELLQSYLTRTAPGYLP